MCAVETPMHFNKKILPVVLIFLLTLTPLGDVSSIDQVGDEVVQNSAMYSNILVFAASFAMPELAHMCRQNHDIYPFLAAGGLLLYSEFFNKKTYRSKTQEIKKKSSSPSWTTMPGLPASVPVPRRCAMSS